MKSKSNPLKNFRLKKENLDMNMVLVPFHIVCLKELEKANDCFPAFSSEHEGYAVIKEEFEELWEEIKTKIPQVDELSQLRHTISCQKLKELIQVTAMCYKFFVSCVSEKTVESVFAGYNVDLRPKFKKSEKKSKVLVIIDKKR